ncbi:MAG: FHA domain-containing protein [Thermoguttaceae bacterium]|jgi:hypothetical protein
MDVRLVVANGRNIGHVIPITGTEFLIGRADDCHLRPRSDVISRYHCTILVKDSFVIVRDSSSKNGTFVNGRQVMGEQVLKHGDRLRVGQLEFDIDVSPAQGTSGAPQSSDRPNEAGGLGGAGNLDLSDWIGKEDSSGTVLGMLPLRRATTLEPNASPDTSEKPKDGDSGSQSPKK